MLDPTDNAMLTRFGNMLSALFGGPVYLVGSALQEGNENPRDWDLRLSLPDEWFALRYDPLEGVTPTGVAHVVKEWRAQRYSGSYTALYWRWADEMVRYSNMGRRQCGLNIDFQVYPQSFFDEYKDRPRRRLDTR